MKARLMDFEWLFGIAKAHGLSFQNVRHIAVVELGKPLNQFTAEEIRDFGFRLCPEVSEVSRIHPQGDA
jgi:hypothetical protein